LSYEREDRNLVAGMATAITKPQNGAKG